MLNFTSIMASPLPIWYLYSTSDIKQLEAVQHQAARWSVAAIGIQLKNVGQTHQIPVSIGLHYMTDRNISLFASCTVFVTTTQPYHLMNIFPGHSCTNPFLIDLSTSSINAYRYSFFINSPFLWNTIPMKILQISHTKLFRSALRRLIF